MSSQGPTAVVFADTHVHLYGCHPLGRALDSAWRNLDHLAGPAGDAGAHRVLCLTERSDVAVFRQLRQDPDAVPGWQIRTCSEPESLTLTRDHSVLHILAGRQIATAERLEVLALATAAELPGELSADDAIASVLRAGGVPVLAWAPGKWSMRRRDIVGGIIARSAADRLVIGDSAMRPAGGSEPRLFSRAAEKGIRIIAGSDPLPFAGEELRIGTYGVRVEGDFDPERPAESFRRLVRNGSMVRVGARLGLLAVAVRLVRNALTRRASR